MAIRSLLKQKLAIPAWTLGCSFLEKKECREFEEDKGITHPLGVSLRVAFVKQSTYCELYADSSTNNPQELLKSSIHRTGPIGLFLGFKTNFFIVHPEPDPECCIWQEKLNYEIPGTERARRFPQLREMQAKKAVSAYDVDWSQFDIVIALENAIPASITKNYKTTLWCTMLEHHRLRSYFEYLRRPPLGYHAFLNLRYGPTPQSFYQGDHVVDFPYGLNFAGGLREIYKDVPQAWRGVMLEDHHNKDAFTAELESVDLELRTGIKKGSTLFDYHHLLASSRILLAPCPKRPLGGLAAIDAASLACLVVGNRAAMWNPFLVLPELDCRNYVSAIQKTRQLLEDESYYNACLKKQNARLNWFCWRRPLTQLAQVRSHILGQ